MVGTDRKVYDFLSVGFGPAGLAIAIAAHEKGDMSFLAIDEHSDFKWHPGMLIPGAKMQISFVKDLATLRDPKSSFTFLNYLFENNRLMKFLNLDTFLPAREEYQDYMHWAAQKIQKNTGAIRYSTIVTSFEPTEDPAVLRVVAKGPKGVCEFFAKNVVVCTGGQPSLPESFPRHKNVHHSSEFMEIKDSILAKEIKHGVCVIGSGQSSAEIWSQLTKDLPSKLVDLRFRSSALKPSDDSPFVNQIFDPNHRIDEWYQMPAKARKALIDESRATNYSVVRLHLLEEMYQHLYTQDLPGHTKVHHISPNSIVDDWETTDDSVIVRFHDSVTGLSTSQIYDHVFCATGYQRNFHTSVLTKFPDVDFPPADSTADDASRGQPIVNRHYRVSRTDGDKKAGIYLQGLCESSHGLSDTLLSVLATRSMEVVEDITSRLGVRSSGIPINEKSAAKEIDAISKSSESHSDSNYGSEEDSRSSSPSA